MSTLYVDSIPMNDTIPKSYQFAFKGDSLQHPDSLVLYIIRKIGSYQTALEFKYQIDQTNGLIKVYKGDTGELQRTFKVVCLDYDHLAFQYTEPDKDDPTKTLHIEYRFLADYSQ